VAPTIIADFYPVSSRGKVLAWFYAAIPVGSALGYVVGSLFYDHWHWAFYVTVPPGILLGIMCFAMRDPRHQSHPTAIQAIAPEAATPAAVTPPRKRATAADYAKLLRIPSYLLNTIGMTAMTFAIGGISFFMPRWLEGRGLDPKQAGVIFGGIVVVSGLVATIAGGMLGDKLRSRFPGSYFLVSGAGMLVGFPFFLLMLVTPFPWCWIVIFLAVFCLFFNTGPSNTIIANVTAPSVRATAFAMNILVIHALGDAISPPLIGLVAAKWNLDVGFMVVSGMMVLGGVVWLLGARHLARDTAAATAADAGPVTPLQQV
jgi:MFS family permease